MNYIETIEECFKNQFKNISDEVENWESDIITRDGYFDVLNIKEKYNITDINFIKPGVGKRLGFYLEEFRIRFLLKT